MANDSDIFSQVISTGSSDQEIEVSLSNFNSLQDVVTPSAIDAPFEMSSVSFDHDGHVQQRPVTTSLESIEEHTDTISALPTQKNDSANDLDCILAEAEGELMALLGSSLANRPESHVSLAESDKKETHDLDEMIDLPTLITRHDKIETIAVSTMAATDDTRNSPTFSEQTDDRSILSRPELQLLDTSDRFGEIQLATCIGEDSVDTEDLKTVDGNAALPTQSESAISSIETANGEVNTSLSQSTASMLHESTAAVNDASEINETTVKIAETHLVEEHNLYQDTIDFSFDYATNKSENSVQSSLDARYDEEKKWDTISMPYQVDNPTVRGKEIHRAEYMENSLTYSRHDSDSIAETETGNLNRIKPQTDCNVGEIGSARVDGELDSVSQASQEEMGFDASSNEAATVFNEDVATLRIACEKSSLAVTATATKPNGFEDKLGSLRMDNEESNVALTASETAPAGLDDKVFVPRKDNEESNLAVTENGTAPDGWIDEVETFRITQGDSNVTVAANATVYHGCEDETLRIANMESNVAIAAAETVSCGCEDEVHKLRIHNEGSNVGVTASEALPDACEDGAFYKSGSVTAPDTPRRANEEPGDAVVESSSACEDEVDTLRTDNDESTASVTANDAASAGLENEVDAVPIASETSNTAIATSETVSLGCGDEAETLQISNEESNEAVTESETAPTVCEDQVESLQIDSKSIVSANETASLGFGDEAETLQISNEESNEAVTESETAPTVCEDQVESLRIDSESKVLVSETTSLGCGDKAESSQIANEESNGTVSESETAPILCEDQVEPLRIDSKSIISANETASLGRGDEAETSQIANEESNGASTICKDGVYSLRIEHQDSNIAVSASEEETDGCEVEVNAQQIANAESNVAVVATETLPLGCENDADAVACEASNDAVATNETAIPVVSEVTEDTKRVDSEESDVVVTASETMLAVCEDEGVSLQTDNEGSNGAVTANGAAPAGRGNEMDTVPIASEVSDGCEKQVEILQKANEESNGAVSESETAPILCEDNVDSLRIDSEATVAASEDVTDGCEEEVESLRIANEESDGALSEIETASTFCKDGVYSLQIEREDSNVTVTESGILPDGSEVEVKTQQVANAESNVAVGATDILPVGYKDEVVILQIAHKDSDDVLPANVIVAHKGCEGEVDTQQKAIEGLGSVTTPDACGEDAETTPISSEESNAAVRAIETAISDGSEDEVNIPLIARELLERVPARYGCGEETETLRIASEGPNAGVSANDFAPTSYEDERETLRLAVEEANVAVTRIEIEPEGFEDATLRIVNEDVDSLTAPGACEDEVETLRISNATVAASETIPVGFEEDVDPLRRAFEEPNVAVAGSETLPAGCADDFRMANEDLANKGLNAAVATNERTTSYCCQNEVDTQQIANTESNAAVAASETLPDASEDEVNTLQITHEDSSDTAKANEKAVPNRCEDEVVILQIANEESNVAFTANRTEPEGGNASTCDHQKPSESSRPPLFPSKRADLHENPDELLNFLSSKLRSHKPPRGGTEPARTMKAVDKTFDPDLSVFTRMDNDSFRMLDLSPPGSPPEPFFDTEGDESSSDESCQVPSQIAFALAHPEILSWDMVPSTSSFFEDASNHPELIVTGNLVDDSEIIVPDSPRGHMTWTGASFPDLESFDQKEITGLAKSTVFARSHRRRFGPDILGKCPRSSSSHSARRSQKMSLTRTASLRRHSPRFWKRKSNVPPLSLARSTEEPSSPLQEINGKDSASLSDQPRKHGSNKDYGSTCSKLRGTVDFSNLQSLEDSSSMDDKDKDSLQFSKETLLMGDREDESGLSSFAQETEDKDKRAVELHSSRLIGSCDGTLVEELMLFSKVRELNFPFHYHHGDCVRYVASLQWKQLQASWLHNEVTRSSLLNQQLAAASTFSNGDEISYSGSIATSHCMTVNTGIDLQLWNAVVNMDGSKWTAGDLVRLSAYFSWDRSVSDGSHLKHNVQLENERKAEAIMNAALSMQGAFSSIVQDICGFATSGDGALNPTEDGLGILYCIDVKGKDAIELKAARKYNGDILQVKDVLRSSIVFPNEGALLCGLSRLVQIENARGCDGASGEQHTKVSIVRVKNLFRASSPVGGLVLSDLPTGYRHILVNIQMNDEFIAEIQFNLSAFYNVLGDAGPILHRDLNELQHVVSSRSSELSCLDINKVIECATGAASPPHEFSKSQVVLKSEEAESLDNELGTENPSNHTELPIAVDSTIVLPNKNISWSDMDFGGSISESLKMKLLNELRKDGTKVSEEEVSLALLECASACASEKPRDATCSFCFGLVILYHARTWPIERVSTLCDAIDNPNELFSFARSCLVRCLSLYNQMNSNGMLGWLEYGESTAVSHQMDVLSNVLTFLAFIYAEEERWDAATSVLETLIVKCEEIFAGAHPIIITSLLDLASLSRRTGNHSYASHLLARATERVSLLLVETEASYMEYLHNASKDNTKEAPIFCVDKGRDSFESLRHFIIALQETTERQNGLQKYRDIWICSIHHRILGDSLAVLANCEQATWIHLSTSSSDESCMETIRYFWSLSLLHFEKAFAGFSTVAGFENRDVSGAVFGMARCLRELGETDKALELLSMVVAGLETSPPIVQNSLCPDLKPSSTSYISHAVFMSKQDHPQVQHHVMRALCLWLMSILSVDKSKKEDGRNRAFRFLHTSSVSLQLALTEMHDGDEKTRKICVDFLEKIEREAKNISQHR